ncbi:GntR family transcriptional regulator [Microbacterium sp. SORGH_AS 1204]|uniref:GntR family transcriptional regulator n=1 Tax=Microbacterium sp. SORGH_AS_1204 TaxID=3041785 RepID=UPI0027917E11|nr:GntR family transcriptional regulator [Microbacterium sp. SORGH_AS_1204]MDQ1137824.1 GntR family transcriptional regulator [Microbacterium sp. SORGH_AS_1204]
MTTGTAGEVAQHRLREWMTANAFLPGERLGSERGLAERFGVSRAALRWALDRLEAGNEVRRAMGRTGGVFADDGKLQRQVKTTLGVPAIARQQGYDVMTKVRGCEVVEATPAQARALRLHPGAPVVRLRRLRSVKGSSWSLDESVLPAERFPGIERADLSGSLYALLRDVFSLRIGRTEETVEGVSADAEQADALDVDQGASLLVLRRIAWDDAGAPFEWALDAFRADRTRLQLAPLPANWKRHGDA